MPQTVPRATDKSGAEYAPSNDDRLVQTPAGFLRVVARAVDKPIVLTPESLPSRHLLVYDPATDAVAVRAS
jgi:hypothetical protein